MIDAKEIFTASLVLFAVIDKIGNIPLVISLREKVGHIQSEKASIIAAIIMVGFLFVGEEILNLIGIDINSFAVAGSFIGNKLLKKVTIEQIKKIVALLLILLGISLLIGIL